MSQAEKTKSNKENKAQLRIAGAGIAGLVVLGGALAAAALVAALRNRSKQRPATIISKDPRPKDSSQELDFSNKEDGVPSLLQTPSPSMEDHQSEKEASVIHSITTESSDPVAIKSLILEMCPSQINVEAADDYGTGNRGISTGQEDADHSKEDTEDATTVETTDTLRESMEETGQEDADHPKEDTEDVTTLETTDTLRKSMEETGQEDTDQPKEDTEDATTLETTDTLRESMEEEEEEDEEEEEKEEEKEEEENPSMELLGNNNNKEDTGGCSKGTGDSSLESKTDDINKCPVETTDTLRQSMEEKEEKEEKGEEENPSMELLGNNNNKEDTGGGSKGTGDSSLESKTDETTDTLRQSMDEEEEEEKEEEENPSMELLGNNNNKEDTGGGSKGTGDSSLESKTDDINKCPVETTDTLRQSMEEEEEEEEEENPSMELLGNNNSKEDTGGSSKGTGDSSLGSKTDDINKCPLETQMNSSDKIAEEKAENGVDMYEAVEKKKGEIGSVKVMENGEMQSHMSSRVVSLVSSMVVLLLLLLLTYLITKSYTPSVFWPPNATQRLEF